MEAIYNIAIASYYDTLLRRAGSPLITQAL